ncbi:hypothetical protein A2U01_0083190, partial [Trifolium medium]|nr:hypothetical protein [Trifolium medium]
HQGLGGICCTNGMAYGKAILLGGGEKLLAVPRK